MKGIVDVGRTARLRNVRVFPSSKRSQLTINSLGFDGDLDSRLNAA